MIPIAWAETTTMEVQNVIDEFAKEILRRALDGEDCRSSGLEHFNARLRSASAQRSSRRQSNFRFAAIRSPMVWRPKRSQQRG